ncbi:UDP-4-amino-4,6-dideoxy-N-acetyl-beta-L-altrosamine transaminase [Promethearchaeum syntrophicum]|uniref:UDP-4-amino-4, 6-dideoxy-N-acetyl-beta-L-altrosamine transaminase n=1 Tax=Promethearchaeum syntrophicum TaxID=2594042 RepID=A0A5B9DA97_9ARCH|nr:UDP-4-amino-4,6-dideoxy-N-acetyl-beta-L-altrosamine transaminase [Candidatus Prometheoarchaeum syntrophicum]QEE16033.1 UDP-4-amino-4-deoxy-L-arabinose--oxoglutarate aminotransferase [Candidatus Prometheoarchaeum syntrophicum]
MNIPYSRQTINDDDIQAVIDVLKSDYLTTGPKVREFEESFAKRVGVKYAIAMANGTAALHIACLAADLGKDDELITSPLTFAASANCALYCGAKPVFIDIKPNGLIDESKIEEKITSKTKILIPVHYSGLPCEMEKISCIAKKHNLIIIEDASHALGARYNNHSIGDCSYSDMAIFSFHPVKHIATGEGGMIVTNSQEFANKIRVLRTHGITKKQQDLSHNEGSWYYEMQMLGYNYRLSDIHSALGLSQLKKLDQFVKRRREIAQEYYNKFKNNPYFEMIYDTPNVKSSYHLFPILLKDQYISKKRIIFEEMRKNGLWVQVHYIPIHLFPYYQKLGYKKGSYPISEEFYKREISIPIYPGMSDNDVKVVITTIYQIFEIQ